MTQILPSKGEGIKKKILQAGLQCCPSKFKLELITPRKTNTLNWFWQKHRDKWSRGKKGGQQRKLEVIDKVSNNQ